MSQEPLRRSVTQPIRCLAQLILRSLHIPFGRVEILVAEHLRQRNQIVPVVGEELVGELVPQQVRVQLETTEHRILVEQAADSTVSQRPTLSHEHIR